MRTVQASKQALYAYLLAALVAKGSSTSGNWGHKGVKGRRGGSAPGGGHTQLGITGTTSPGGKEKIINLYRRQQAEKKKPTAEQARNKIARIESATQAKIDKLKAKQKAILQAREDYMDDHGLEDLYDRYRIARRAEGAESDPDVIAMREEIDQHDANLSDMWDEHQALGKEQRALENGAREATMKVLEVPKDQQAKVQLRTKDPTIEKTAQKGLDIFNRLYGRGTMDGTAVTVDTHNRSRAGYDPLVLGGTGRILLYSSGPGILTSTSSATSMLHEMGHWLEERDHGVFQKAKAFLLSRTQKDPAQKMADLKPDRGYAEYEITRPDRFIDPYVGRAYVEPGVGHYATEIVSMGMELFFTDPGQFARDDPGHFDFIYNLMRDRP